jgi:hypothetical protein
MRCFLEFLAPRKELKSAPSSPPVVMLGAVGVKSLRLVVGDLKDGTLEQRWNPLLHAHNNSKSFLAPAKSNCHKLPNTPSTYSRDQASSSM